MIFTPTTWQESESDMLRDNLENSVRRLTIEQRVITALRSSQERNEERIRDPARIVKNEPIIDEPINEGDVDDERILRAIEDEDRIDTTSNCMKNASEVDDSCGTNAAAGDK